MSAVLKPTPVLAPMREQDLAEVMAIESVLYTHPWTRGNFADSLRAGYECRAYRVHGGLIGYFVLLAAAGEAHLLNLSIAEVHQRRGYGTALLRSHGTCAQARREERLSRSAAEQSRRTGALLPLRLSQDCRTA